MLEIDENGKRCWKNEYGELHREDGPACEYNEGSKCWYLNGERHRVDGPAIEWSDGSKEWWLKDQEYTKEEYKRKVREIC